MNHTKPVRIVGIAVNKKNLGFCVLEQPDFLLDWGVQNMKDRTPETIEKLLAPIFNYYHPDYIALEKVDLSSTKLTEHNILFLEMVQRFALSKGVSVLGFTRLEIQQKFNLPVRYKSNQLAQKISEQYVVFARVIPHARKTWQSEPRVNTLFKAIAVAIIQ